MEALQSLYHEFFDEVEEAQLCPEDKLLVSLLRDRRLSNLKKMIVPLELMSSSGQVVTIEKSIAAWKKNRKLLEEAVSKSENIKLTFFSPEIGESEEIVRVEGGVVQGRILLCSPHF